MKTLATALLPLHSLVPSHMNPINWAGSFSGMSPRHSSFVTRTNYGFAFATYRGTQRIVSVNYLFGRPLIPSDFLETIVTLNFRDMRNLMSVAFGLSKLSFLVPKKGQLSFSERREDLKFSGLDKKIPNKFENTQVPLEYPNR